MPRKEDVLGIQKTLERERERPSVCVCERERERERYRGEACSNNSSIVRREKRKYREINMKEDNL